MSTALSIVFTGLCALVGDGDGRPADVLLLETRDIGQVRGVTLPPHAPTLVVSLNDLANPDSSRPTRDVAGGRSQNGRVDQLGLWDLTGFEVRIRAQGGREAGGLRFFQPSRDETSWPGIPRNVHDPAAWRDLRFVPSMKALVGDGRINPALVGNGESARGLPRAVAARIHLDAGLLEGALPSQESFRGDLFEFTSDGSEHTLRQPLTDTVEWTLRTEASAVVIDLIPAAGGEPRRLLLAPSSAPHRLFVSNLPTENSIHAGAHATNDEDMAGLHFGAYYGLLLEQPTRMPLPTVSRAEESRKGASGLRPVICYPAMFSRQ